ncbi:hypothetical protein G6F37_008067 [Rhizopus arrhizus]|nr:hypothetical protein G6F38_005132 [Rhizopus arrhizus]KAG1155942.1 hypothetical protein G6F37_008067 [Rhizopus arrhizus]
MTLDEFAPEEDYLSEISRKLSNVSITKRPSHGVIINKCDLPTAKYLLYSTEYSKIEQSAEAIRRYLVQDTEYKKGSYQGKNSLVDDVLNLDILSRLKELLCTESGRNIKCECLWILINISAGDPIQTKTIVDHGLMDLLLDLTKDKSAGLENNTQAAWVLANVAADTVEAREELLKKGFAEMIVNILNEIYRDISDLVFTSKATRGYISVSNNIYGTTAETLLWTLSNLSRGGFRTADYYETHILMFDIFSKYALLKVEKFEVDICWGLSRVLLNMHGVEEFYSRTVISVELCKWLAEMLSYDSSYLVKTTIRILISLTAGPDVGSLSLIQSPVLINISPLLEPEEPSELRKDAYMIIANLVAGNDILVEHVVSHRTVMNNVIAHIKVPGHIYSSSGWQPTRSSTQDSLQDEWKVTKEVLWIAFNLTTVGSDETIKRLLENHPNFPYNLAILLNYLYLSLDICEKTLESITALIQRTNKWIGNQNEGKNPYVTLLIENQTPMALTVIQENQLNGRISELCLKLGRLLVASDESASQAAAIADSEDMSHAFGLPSIAEIKSKSNKRRVIRGTEDGDVRLIENAVGNLCI